MGAVSDGVLVVRGQEDGGDGEKPLSRERGSPRECSHSRKTLRSGVDVERGELVQLPLCSSTVAVSAVGN